MNKSDLLRAAKLTGDCEALGPLTPQQWRNADRAHMWRQRRYEAAKHALRQSRIPTHRREAKEAWWRSWGPAIGSAVVAAPLLYVVLVVWFSI